MPPCAAHSTKATRTVWEALLQQSRAGNKCYRAGERITELDCQGEKGRAGNDRQSKNNNKIISFGSQNGLAQLNRRQGLNLPLPSPLLGFRFPRQAHARFLLSKHYVIRGRVCKQQLPSWAAMRVTGNADGQVWP